MLLAPERVWESCVGLAHVHTLSLILRASHLAGLWVLEIFDEILYDALFSPHFLPRTWQLLCLSTVDSLHALRNICGVICNLRALCHLAQWGMVCPLYKLTNGGWDGSRAGDITSTRPLGPKFLSLHSTGADQLCVWSWSCVSAVRQWESHFLRRQDGTLVKKGVPK